MSDAQISGTYDGWYTGASGKASLSAWEEKVSESVNTRGTYKTFEEQKEVLSPAEQRFEKARQTTGLILGPIVFIVMLLVPLPLEPNQQTLAAILALPSFTGSPRPFPFRPRRCWRWRFACS